MRGVLQILLFGITTLLGIPNE